MDSCTLGQSVVHFLTVNYSVVVGGGGTFYEVREAHLFDT